MRRAISACLFLVVSLLPADAAWSGRYKLVLVMYAETTAINSQVAPSSVSMLVLDTFNNVIDCQMAAGAELIFPLSSISVSTPTLHAVLLCSPSY